MSEQWLPDGWRWAKFGDIVENFDGRRVPIKLDQRKKGQYPYYGASGVIDYVDKYIFDGEYLLISEDGANLVMRTYPIAFKATGQFWVNNHAHIVQPKEGVLVEFLLHYFAIADISPYVAGAAQPKLTQANLNKILIPLPPFAEQQRIAAILEEQMADIEAARIAIESELEAADSLTASYLREVFESDEAEEWECVSLIEICARQGQYGLSLKSSYDETGIPILGMGNIRDGEIVWKSLKYLTAQEAELDKYGLTEGDILFNRTNSAELVGKTAIFDGSREAVFASYLIRFRAKPEKADPHFISAYINSTGRAFIERNMARAIGQVNISASTMHKMPIPLPPLELQLDIVNRWSNQLTEVNTISAIAQDRLDAINAMPTAVLRRAFNGEL